MEIRWYNNKDYRNIN